MPIPHWSVGAVSASAEKVYRCQQSVFVAAFKRAVDVAVVVGSGIVAVEVISTTESCFWRSVLLNGKLGSIETAAGHTSQA